jgi:hypothetical protein
MWHRKFVGEVSEWPARVWVTVYRCHGGENVRLVCSSEYIKADVLCVQHHRVVPLNHSNPVHINTTTEQYIHSFVIIFYACWGRSLDHLQIEDTSTCCRRGLLFLVCMQDRHLKCPHIEEQRLATVSVHPWTFYFRNYSPHTDVQKI